MLGIPAELTVFATSFGSEAENALKQGASMEQAGLSAAVSAGTELLTEKFSDGIKLIGGKTLTEAMKKKLAQAISNKTARTLIGLGLDTAGEGFEEVLTEAVSALGQKLTYASEKEMKELLTRESLWDAFIGGAVMGNTSGTVKAVTGNNLTGWDGREVVTAATGPSVTVGGKKYLFLGYDAKGVPVYEDAWTVQEAESRQKHRLDTDADSFYDDIRSADTQEPVYMPHQYGQDLRDIDYAVWKEKKEKAAFAYRLSAEEYDALEAYVGGEAYSWNAALRGESGYESTEYIDYWIRQTNSGFKKFPQFQGRTYRNLSFMDSKSLTQFLRQHKVGENIKVSYFASSSKDPNGYTVPGDQVVHMVIDGFSGRDISESFSIPWQREVVYLPGTKFRITAVETANDGNPLIYAQEVIENGKDLETDSGRNGQGVPGTNPKG